MKKKNNIKSKWLVWGLLVALVQLGASGAGADEMVLTREQPVVETAHTVMAMVSDGLVTLKVRRHFLNSGVRPEQVEMEIELPRDSVATGLRIKANNKWYAGDLMEAEAALKKYTELTGMGSAKLQDPALLSWGDQGLLNLRVFPVIPHKTATVEYTLIQPLQYKNGKQFFFYNKGDGQSNLAVPTLAITKAPGKKTVFIDGRRATIGKPLQLNQQSVVSADCFDEGGQYLQWGDDGNVDNYAVLICPGPRETLVELQAPPIDTLAQRYGIFEVGDGQSIVRLEIDAASVLRSGPKKASVVFVIDGSYSFSVEGIQSALNFARTFVGQLEDAQYEIVLFQRRGTRVFKRFVSAKKFAKALAEEVTQGAFAPQNGSNLEQGLALATQLLAKRPGPKRIIAITDGEFKTSYQNSESISALKAPNGYKPRNNIVHLVQLLPGASGEPAVFSRDDEADLAPVPLAFGGIFTLVEGGYQPSDFSRAALELVRPTRIDFFEIAPQKADILFEGDFPETLKEGAALRYMYVSEESVGPMVVKGKIWAKPFKQIIWPSTRYSLKTVPALAFGDNTHDDLSDQQQMKAALAGGAVSPVTSYLSIEPGTRPSPEGLDNDQGGGIGSGYGRGSGTIGAGRLGKVRLRTEEYQKTLEHLAQTAAAPCWTAITKKQTASVNMETTINEIVELSVSLENKKVQHCIQQALWTIQLPSEFENLYRFNFKFELGN